MKAAGCLAEVIRWATDGVSAKTLRVYLKEKNRGLHVKGPPTAPALSSADLTCAPKKNPPGASRRGDCSPSQLFRTYFSTTNALTAEPLSELTQTSSGSVGNSPRALLKAK